MKYRHTITGAIVEVDSKIAGDWELLDEKEPAKRTPRKSNAKRTPKKTTAGK